MFSRQVEKTPWASGSTPWWRAFTATTQGREIDRTLQQMLSTGRSLASQYQRGLIESETRQGLDRK
jgi:hypothetical protein